MQRNAEEVYRCADCCIDVVQMAQCSKNPLCNTSDIALIEDIFEVANLSVDLVMLVIHHKKVFNCSEGNIISKKPIK